MKQLKVENVVGSTEKSTMYTFIMTGVIGKGRGRGLRYLADKDNMSTKSLFPQSSNVVKQYLQYVETGSIGMGRGQGLKYSIMSFSQGMETIGKKYTQEFETCSMGKGLEQKPISLSSSLGFL
ncbi:hypothetical protein P3L10_003412 [Capsicum annuum]